VLRFAGFGSRSTETTEGVPGLLCGLASRSGRGRVLWLEGQIGFQSQNRKTRQLFIARKSGDFGIRQHIGR